MASEPNGIRTRPAPNCLLCGTSGRPLYENLVDRSYAAPGRWSFRKCERRDCGLVWLDPVPLLEELSKAYQGYYTHNQPEPGPSLIRDACWAVWRSYLGGRFGYAKGTGPKWLRLFAPLALLHPGGRDELDAAAMHLPAPKGSARVLDVGCGSGVALARMKSFGWEVEGVELDVAAVEAARARGVSVRSGTLEQQRFPDSHFDAVYSAHVIEHVHDPIGLLRECGRVLKTDGTLIILTPNVESWGHRRFGAAWLNLDPPRHLVLFSSATLRRAAEQSGLKIARLETTARNAWVYGALSHCIRQTGRAEMKELSKPGNLLRGMIYQLRQRCVRSRDAQAGDELRLFATK